MNESLIEQTASGKLKTMPQQRYVSNKNESARMFESNFLEFFSHVHPATPHVIYLPLMGWMFYLAAERGQSAGTIAGLSSEGSRSGRWSSTRCTGGFFITNRGANGAGKCISCSTACTTIIRTMPAGW
jgi:hypothetical protein